MRDEVADAVVAGVNFSWEARDLNGVLLELHRVPIGVMADAGAGQEEVVGAEGAIPVREGGA